MCQEAWMKPTCQYPHNSGRKAQWYREKWDFLSETIFLLSDVSMVCFQLPKCVYFYQWYLSISCLWSWSQYYVCMINIKQCWKKNTPCQGVVWFYLDLPYALSFTLGRFICGTLPAQLKPPEVSEQPAKRSRTLPSSSCWGLHAPDPANPCFWIQTMTFLKNYHLIQ